ncbi:hypothetical protein [Herbiconiux daphne]|uniref:DUF3618 domain-containing protein n=1 Tax=Herbiconiux daphne TaxID=2970914 RepID=A0ABT2H5M4_9MICO|nr:hypothetical protein [Herbiconiux daphne]MCS5735221.1 hypothetical protein [Herbiconiux daphne]
MSESYVPVPPSGFEPAANDEPGKVDTAKQEAADLKDTAAEQVGNVAGTAKEEAGNVAREAKSQAKDLYLQSQQQLKEQAGVQQQRVASGLRSLGDELGEMASSSENSGLASDLVRQVSERAGSAASWLDARDPGSLLAEVKSYARRKPGTFIAVAAVAGVVAGRLTRALAGSAADEKQAAEAASASGTPAASAPVVTAPVVPVPDPAADGVADAPFTGAPAYSGTAGVVDDTPLYTERVASFGDDLPADGSQR